MEQTLWMAVITAMLSTAAVADYLTNYQAAVLAAAPLPPPPPWALHHSFLPYVVLPPMMRGNKDHGFTLKYLDCMTKPCCCCTVSGHAAFAVCKPMLRLHCTTVKLSTSLHKVSIYSAAFPQRSVNNNSQSSPPQHVPLCCSPIDDYRFPLMRHWSLFEAMMHSPYVAVRLQTWHDKGRRLLQDMLVKMGFPAPQFRQKWSEYLTPASYPALYSHVCTHAG